LALNTLRQLGAHSKAMERMASVETMELVLAHGGAKKGGGCWPPARPPPSCTQLCTPDDQNPLSGPRKAMSLSHQRALQLVKLLNAELPGLFQKAVDISLHQSSAAVGYVNELESLGYQVKAELDFALFATPVEVVFEQSLDDSDRRFLRGLSGPIPEEKNIKEGTNREGGEAPSTT
jgi:hypothetical protein